ncbi:hypothetical protein JYK14_09575 [Siccirubricoccus sp. KC 17139]|uniref:RidA family protein n=1 Tax=Siccirubricoccus soli TaxID=2899147 RepID=A0ABT1D5Z0_9PROT|nr:hypothetical protein [Siccirubricoccus soli]MCO6416415.1 hypothetical protein [Siccirubricoccus soli]MCP2682549.1 hypothetical protein [Siccirubricoccus soli]
MYETRDRPEDGYRFIPAVFQYSAGVAALPGFRIERVRFTEPVPMAAGFARIAAYLQSLGRPLTAFCACELRSPGQFTEEGFRQFNLGYAKVLGEWGILEGSVNPVARSNVCPELMPPAEPGFHAFSYTVPEAGAAPSFVNAGSGESTEGKGSYEEQTIALGDLSPAGLRRKAEFVLGEMERRMAALGGGWASATGVQVYTVHDIFPFLGDELVRRGAGRHGVTWQFCRPPVINLEYEMDVRGVAVERVIPA